MPQIQEHREVQEVVRAHAGWVFACAKRRVRDDALAEDVAQAVFILFWQKGARLGGEAKVTGWLYRAVAYCAANALRLKRIRQRHEKEAAMAGLADASAGEGQWGEVSPELEWAVDRLREKDRAAVLLRFYRQMSFVEVGQSLGISEEAARKRVDRALESLRGALAKKGVMAGVGALGVAMAEKVTEAAPAGLAEAATAAVASGGAGVAGVIAKGAIKMMALSKAKFVVAVVAIVLFTGGIGAILYGQVTQRGSNANTAADGKQGIAATQPSTSQPSTRVAATPKGICLAAYAAMRAGDEQGFISYHSNLTPQREQVMRIRVGYISSMSDMARAAEAKFGKQEAAPLSQMATPAVNQVLVDAEETIAGDTAVVRIHGGAPGDVLLVRVGSRWLIASGDWNPASDAATIKIEPQMSQFRKLAKDIADGKYATAQDVLQAVITLSRGIK